MAFPVSPTNGQQTSVNDILYVYSSSTNSWKRQTSTYSNITLSGNIVTANVVTGNIFAGNYLYSSNGVSILSALNSFQSTIEPNIGTLYLGNVSTQANIGAFHNYANANIGTIRTNLNTLDANVGAYHIYANANIGTLYLGNVSTQANIGTIRTNLNTLDANVGAFHTYANTKIGNNTNSNVVILSTTDSTSATTGALVISGGAGVAGNLYVAGNIFASNLISIGTTTLTVTDPLLYLNVDNPSPYNYDIGFFSHFVGGTPSHYQHTGFARNSANNTWTLFSNVFAEPGATINWAEANIIYDSLKVGSATIANTTVSTSTTSGALIVSGGVGIAGTIYASGASISPGTTLADALNLNNNNLYNVNTIRISDPGTSEGITWEGGSGWYIYESPDDLSNDVGNLQVVLNGTRTFTVTTDGTINIPNTRAATSTTTGALTVTGGISSEGNIYADRLYTTVGLFWSGNGQVISTGGGGGGSSTLAGLSDVAISGPTPGQVLKYNGSQWINGTDNTGSGGGGGGSGITFTADSIAPLSANVADQWYDTASDILFEYINDGDSNQWVDISSGPISANTRVNLSSTGNLQISGHFFPGVDNTYDLGNVTYSWRNLQLDGRATVGNITTTSGIFYSNGASASYANTRVAQYLPVYSGNVSAANLTPTTSGGNLTVSNGSLVIDTGGNLVIRDGFINPGDTGSIGVNSTVAVTNGNITVMSGSVGIGTTTPAGSLEVTGDVLISNNGNLTVAGNIVQQEAYYEIYSNVAAVGGNLTCNFTNGTIFNVTSISSNVTANFTNVNSLSFGATAATIVIKQSSPAYIVSNIQINGVMQTINWANGIGNQSAPAGLANNTDVISFSLLHLGSGTWRVLGQLGSYA